MNWIWKLPFIKRLVKYKEPLTYLVFGGLTTVVYFLSYFPARKLFNEVTATVIANFTAVTFAYITNKIWVFESKTHTFGQLTKEMIKFYSARIVTLFVDVLLTYVFIKCLKYNEAAVKFISQVLIIILNYVLSKLFVFIRKSG